MVMDSNTNRMKRVWQALNDFNSAKVATVSRNRIFKKKSEANKSFSTVDLAQTSGAAILPAIEEEMTRASNISQQAAQSSSRLFYVMVIIAGTKQLHKERHNA